MPSTGYSLAQALAVAAAQYLGLQASQLTSRAAQRQVAVARNTLIPELSVAYQANVATYNNITGMFYPQYVLPISGPPSTANRNQAVVGSAASAPLTWTPLTFGARTAAIDLAQAQYRAAQASQATTLLGHQVLVADAYLDLLLTTELERVYAQNIRRTEITAHQATVLVTTGLRPGVDSAQFNAEVARAQVDLLTARQSREVAAIRLSELLALPAGEVAATDTTLLTRLPPPPPRPRRHGGPPRFAHGPAAGGSGPAAPARDSAGRAAAAHVLGHGLRARLGHCLHRGGEQRRRLAAEPYQLRRGRAAGGAGAQLLAGARAGPAGTAADPGQRSQPAHDGLAAWQAAAAGPGRAAQPPAHCPAAAAPARGGPLCLPRPRAALRQRPGERHRRGPGPVRAGAGRSKHPRRRRAGLEGLPGPGRRPRRRGPPAAGHPTLMRYSAFLCCN
ncbi:MAG: TolC family protein [Hymenobacter sp.]